MFDSVKRFLSPDCGPFGQFVKYGAIGVLATGVQVVVFYCLAVSLLPCLGTGDWFVRHLGLPSAEVADGVRATRFAVATALGFLVSNLLCWFLNRTFVFRRGRFVWYQEMALFLGVSGLAMALATGLCSLLIHLCALMTTLAILIEVVVSFLLNYFLRKFVIFKG